MKKMKFNNKNVTLTGVTQRFSGYGHRRITCYFEYRGLGFSIYATTTNMSDFDKAMDIDDYEEREIALYEMIAHKIEEEILNTIYEIDEK